MNRIERWVSNKLGGGKAELRACFLITYIWGFAAHGFMFMNNSISHDSLDEFIGVADVMAKKIAAGRFMVPVVQALRGPISAPWWIGILSLLCVSLSVFLIVRMFKISEPWMICLVSGVLTVNQTYIALAATYIHDLDCNSISLLLAVFAVYLWRVHRFGFVLGILPIALSLGLYQSFVAVAITLVIFLTILDLMDSQSFKQVFLTGLKAVVMVLLGAMLYYCLVEVVQRFSGVLMSTGYNSPDNILTLTLYDLQEAVKMSVLGVFERIVCVNSGLPGQLGTVIGNGIVLLYIVAMIGKLFSRSMGMLEKILLVFSCACLPVGMNIAAILSYGVDHDLMRYAYWLIYLLPLLLGCVAVQKTTGLQNQIAKLYRLLAAILVAAVLFGNVQMANCTYTAKRFIQDANLSLFTRVVSDIEDQEGYIPGKTEICLINYPDYALSQLPEQYGRYYTTGFASSYIMGATIPAHYQCYFDYVLMNPGVFGDTELVNSMKKDSRVEEMPPYPYEGSVAMVDDVVVVKFG